MTTNALTWFELSRDLKPGSRVRFVKPVDRYPEGFIIPVGLTATVVENGLNDIWCALSLRPDHDSMRSALAEWDGNIILNPLNDGEAMNDPSPLALSDTLEPCRFTFDDDTVFEGFAHGSTWNGFGNVAVTAAVRDEIIAHFAKLGDDVSDMKEITPMANGLFSLGVDFLMWGDDDEAGKYRKSSGGL